MNLKLIYRSILLVVIVSFSYKATCQVNEINFSHQNFNGSAPPRTALNPMSLKMWDNYGNGGPTTYSTILEIYGLVGHQTSQLSFGGWDNSKIKYREAFYAQNSWSDWISLLDSKNDVESSGLLKIAGNRNHYLSQGKFGIGTTNPDEKLTVKGKIHAEEVKVDLNVPGPDYVFNDDYQLTSLSEIQSYIKSNKHLPEIPSAKEMEANGINLSEMNMLLLKKVEELTLHLIEKDKEIRFEKDRNQIQDARIKKIETTFLNIIQQKNK